jgi:hypothetical protein
LHRDTIKGLVDKAQPAVEMTQNPNIGCSVLTEKKMYKIIAQPHKSHTCLVQETALAVA